MYLNTKHIHKILQKNITLSKILVFVNKKKDPGQTSSLLLLCSTKTTDSMFLSYYSYKLEKIFFWNKQCINRKPTVDCTTVLLYTSWTCKGPVVFPPFPPVRKQPAKDQQAGRLQMTTLLLLRELLSCRRRALFY